MGYQLDARLPFVVLEVSFPYNSPFVGNGRRFYDPFTPIDLMLPMCAAAHFDGCVLFDPQ